MASIQVWLWFKFRLFGWIKHSNHSSSYVCGDYYGSNNHFWLSKCSRFAIRINHGVKLWIWLPDRIWLAIGINWFNLH
jgi:hypothetical protein